MFLDELLSVLRYIELYGPFDINDNGVEFTPLSDKEKDEVYERMINILNFIFVNIPTDEYMERHILDLKTERKDKCWNGVKKDYKNYPYAKDFKKCTFLYCWTIILYIDKRYDEADNTQKELSNLFLSFINYYRFIIFFTNPNYIFSIINHQNIVTFFRKTFDFYFVNRGECGFCR